ncbi:MAG: S8 family serine peptidase [bacterium]
MSFASQRSGLTYAPGIPVYAANQVIVQFVPGTPSTEVGRICAMHQCQHIYSSPYAGYSLLNISPSTTPLQAVQRLRTEASVVYAEPNYYRSAHLLPNDPYYKYQWHLGHLNCSYAWDYGTGAGAVVALLDSGVAYETSGLFAKAPDLAGTLFVPGYDFVNDDTFPDDDYGHGTHMAGCIAQTTNNLIGAAGVAFGAAIMPVKIMDDIGGVLISDEVDGIYFAANNGAHIINMSLGGPGTSVTEAAAVTYAYSRGVTVICSAGNSGSNTAEYPASYPEPVSVSAVRYDFTFASTYSNYGIYVDLCAPGGDLSLDQNGDGFGDGILQQTHDGQNFSTFSYYFLEGTSPASALVSGVAALIVGKSTVPLPPSDVVSILKGSAADLGTSGWDQYYGYGLINAYQAMLQTP